MSLFINTIRALATVLLLTASLSVSATPVVYLLGDHLDAQLYQSNPDDPYGLRYDDAAPAGSGPTFSVGTNLGGLGGATTLTFDADNLAAGAVINGTLERNDDGTFWSVTYTLTDLTAAENGGFKASDGNGSVDEIGGALRSIILDGKQDGSGVAFEFDNDGHRLGTGDGWVGRGWMQPSTQTDDWLVTATVVPVPAAVWLFMSAIGLLSLHRRKR